MNIPNGYAADLQAARAIECEASAGPGTYGAVVRAGNIEPGLYLVIVNNPATIRDADTDQLRASALRQLEVELRADAPLVVALQARAAAVAAYGPTAAVVWLIPLRPIC